MISPKHDDLDWQAYLYTADELDAGQREAFELRLADDQRAREAVAAAVELARAVSLAFCEANYIALRPRRYLTVQWLAVVGAAGLLSLMFTIGLNVHPRSDSHEHALRREHAELARIWGEVVLQQADGETGEEDVHEPTMALRRDDVTASPDWMLAALHSMQSQSKGIQDE